MDSIDPTPLFQKYYGTDIISQLREEVGCHDCQYRLRCITTRSKCGRYIIKEMGVWFLGKFFRFGSNHPTFDEIEEGEKEARRIRTRIYTDNYTYHIDAIPPWTNKKGYLGCVMTNPATGRGNDLADGPYDFQTFVQIMMDIVSCEMREDEGEGRSK
jgi:hypothetical protein